MKKFFKWTRNIIIAFFALSILQVIILKFLPVYYTPYMVYNNIAQSFSEDKMKCEHKWVPLDKISKKLPLAVVASEDNLYMTHSGFDFKEIAKSIEEADKGKRVRGGSTITQQTAKNVFLWHGKSYIRKGLEAYYTVLIEFIWGKERIMEVYLNSIEMGKNIYGAEAVAQQHFNKSASKLTAIECALIAATLPNPVKFNSKKPSKYILKRKTKILNLMKKISPVNFD